jgi:hypothetical protein
MAFLTWLESTSYAEWILVSATGWPLMLTIHAIGLAVIVGIVFAVNLRLLGLYGALPYSALHGLLSVAWIGIFLNVFSGLSIFTTQAVMYVTSIPFIIKLVFIALGCVNLNYMQKELRLEAANWDAAGSASSRGQLLAATSMVFWIIAVVTGRLIAYIG